MFEFIPGGNTWALVVAAFSFLLGLHLRKRQDAFPRSKSKMQAKVAPAQENAVEQAKREFGEEKQALEEKAVEKHEENKTDASAAASAINNAFD
jgi:hypothetical protein